MRVLWLCNIMLPVIAEHLGLEASNKEGWLTGLSNKILAHQEENLLELGICFPTGTELGEYQEKIDIGEKGKRQVLYAYGFAEDIHAAQRYDEKIEQRLKEIVSDFKPDVVHCFGTEYSHTLAMVRAFGNPDRTLIGIQGLCAVYANHYRADLPDYVWNRKTFRDVLKKDDLKRQHQKYVQRGEHEIEAIKGVHHVTGRTHWDKHYTQLWNPDATYHFMNETLRSNFYDGIWNIASCQKHSIFLSQGDYPIKGLHYLLKALPEVLKRYPDTQVYIAGNSIIKTAAEKGLSGIKGKIKLESYGFYIWELLKRGSTPACNMSDHVHFLGRLSAEEMKQRFMQSHLFLCPSSIENSPNSVGEAMLLGMPVVCSDVGGVRSIFNGQFPDDKEVQNPDGILYEVNDTEALEKAILKIFSEDADVQIYCKNAKAHAEITHNPETNYERLLEIYQSIAGEKK